MSWNYRIVKYRNEDAYGLHEVYYNEAGEAWGMTARPVGFVGDTVEELRSGIERGKLAFLEPVFEEPEQWADEPRHGTKASATTSGERTASPPESPGLNHTSSDGGEG